MSSLRTRDDIEYGDPHPHHKIAGQVFFLDGWLGLRLAEGASVYYGFYGFGPAGGSNPLMTRAQNRARFAANNQHRSGRHLCSSGFRRRPFRIPAPSNGRRGSISPPRIGWLTCTASTKGYSTPCPSGGRAEPIVIIKSRSARTGRKSRRPASWK